MLFRSGLGLGREPGRESGNKGKVAASYGMLRLEAPDQKSRLEAPDQTSGDSFHLLVAFDQSRWFWLRPFPPSAPLPPPPLQEDMPVFGVMKFLINEVPCRDHSFAPHVVHL